MLLSQSTNVLVSHVRLVSILVVMDVALAAIDRVGERMDVKVSILVVMDVALAEVIKIPGMEEETVSILVVMDVALAA